MIIFGLSGGMISAAGVFALITTVKVVNRFAIVSKTAGKIMHYESCVIIGVCIGNVLSIFDISMPIGTAGCAIYGILAGCFVGCFAVSLAESLKAIPVLARRVQLSNGLGVIILCVAIGKMSASLVFYLIGGFAN